MSELNKTLDEVQKVSSDLGQGVSKLLMLYEEFYKESDRKFVSERSASDNSMEGLEDFYRLVQTVRRNRDVVGSLARGFKSLRPLNKFKFVEEDIPERTPKEKKKKKEPKKQKIEQYSLLDEPTIIEEPING